MERALANLAFEEGYKAKKVHVVGDGEKISL